MMQTYWYTAVVLLAPILPPLESQKYLPSSLLVYVHPIVALGWNKNQAGILRLSGKEGLFLKDAKKWNFSEQRRRSYPNILWPLWRTMLKIEVVQPPPLPSSIALSFYSVLESDGLREAARLRGWSNLFTYNTTTRDVRSYRKQTPTMAVHFSLDGK